MHHICHMESFLYDHLYQFLWRCNNNDTIHRKGLEHGKRYITGSRWHVHKQIVHIAPDRLIPELFHSPCNHRSSPDNRCLFIFHQKIDGNDFDSFFCLIRIHSFFVTDQLTVCSKHLWNGRSGNIGIQNSYFISGFRHLYRQGRSNK